jgi:2-amino-4-hydroxy-6-hydroxymethyldihydropteridine diphosphokinase
MRTAVALGSNLGDRLANFQAARKAISELPGVTSPILSSPIYETDPVSCESGAAQFLNAVIEFEYAGDVLGLLKSVREIENALGRPPDHPRYVSRKIDIDLLYAGDSKIDRKELQLPHPRIQERKFVLQPLADIRPELILPGQTLTIRELLAQVADSGKVTRTDWNLE